MAKTYASSKKYMPVSYTVKMQAVRWLTCICLSDFYWGKSHLLTFKYSEILSINACISGWSVPSHHLAWEYCEYTVFFGRADPAMNQSHENSRLDNMKQPNGIMPNCFRHGGWSANSLILMALLSCCSVVQCRYKVHTSNKAHQTLTEKLKNVHFVFAFLILD